LGLHPTRSGRHDLLRSSDLVDRQRLLEAGTGQTAERGRLPQVPRKDLGEEGKDIAEDAENLKSNSGHASAIVE